jgi:hypothetical protein
MRLLSVAVTASVIMAGLMGCASSHTKPHHAQAYSKHSYSAVPHHHYSYPHATGHHQGARHTRPRTYYRPAPGKTPDGRYVLPGGLESVCAGGTPPPCQ